jgi:uncharacterized protein (DUF1778 family)
LRWPADLVRAVTKDSRIALRLSSDQGALIRPADEVEGVSITDFTVAPTGAPARYVLDRPVPHTPRLEKLFARPIHEDDDTSTFDRGEPSLDEYLRKPAAVEPRAGRFATCRADNDRLWGTTGWLQRASAS